MHEQERWAHSVNAHVDAGRAQERCPDSDRLRARLEVPVRQAGMLGGDTFDFVRLPDGVIALSIGDVMGKGVSAALMMAGVLGIARTTGCDPARRSSM